MIELMGPMAGGRKGWATIGTTAFFEAAPVEIKVTLSQGPSSTSTVAA